MLYTTFHDISHLLTIVVKIKLLEWSKQLKLSRTTSGVDLAGSLGTHGRIQKASLGRDTWGREGYRSWSRRGLGKGSLWEGGPMALPLPGKMNFALKWRVLVNYKQKLN